MGGAAELPPHVLILPLPVQSHINSMLNLAELLCLSDLHVTVLLSEHAERRLRRHADIETRFSVYPGFRVAAMSDGLPADHPRVGERTMEIMMSLLEVGEAELRKLMETTDVLSHGGSRRRVTCLIMDGVLSFAVPVAQEMGIPFIYFRPSSPCSFWATFCFNDVIQAGEIPLKDDNLDEPIKSVAGMESILRRRDLPSFCRDIDFKDPQVDLVLKEIQNLPLSQGLILNTFHQLDAPILSQMLKLCPNIYSIGPLHKRLAPQETAAHSSSIWEEDRSCISWLDDQPPSSVLYVSIGSLAVMTKDQFLEIMHGVVASGSRFLWVRRPGSVSGSEPDEALPPELAQAAGERGYLVKWPPQEEVLAHPAVGGFFTHSGWNSTLESIVAGKPMVCWPSHVDQLVNSRYVEEVWKVGLDMKDSCDRVVVEKVVREVMESRKDEFLKRAGEMSVLAEASVSDGGSSFKDLDRLIKDIKGWIN